jgi:hypothetical protein
MHFPYISLTCPIFVGEGAAGDECGRINNTKIEATLTVTKFY